jgi:hypothetical protein
MTTGNCSSKSECWNAIEAPSRIRTSGSYLRNRLYSFGASSYLNKIALDTPTWNALEYSMDTIQALKEQKGASVARMFSDEIGLGMAGTLIKRDDVNNELPHLAHLLNFFRTQKRCIMR